jgi:hypothetical protein
MRLRILLWAALFSLASGLPALAAPPTPPIPNLNADAAAPGTASDPAAPLAPYLQNPNMECSQGYHAPPDGTAGLIPNGWTWSIINGKPLIDSNRTHFTGQCGTGGFVEKIEGDDAWAMFSQDIETPPNPGKPFDAYIYQQATVTPGTIYSLSGWMVSFCGGTFSNPNDCPSGYYISKQLGLDPTGGTDPLASTVVWVEDRRNFTESRWVNLHLGGTAQSNKVTVFARINSPFLHHGAFALIDAISLMDGPTANFVNMPTQVAGATLNIQWNGALSADIRNIAGGTHQLYYDVDYRQGQNGQWQSWLQHNQATSATFHPVCSPSADQSYYFRVKPLAEQPDGSNGAWPNHRYEGVWAESGPVACDTTPPVAQPDAATTAEDTPVTINVLANDSDPEPDDVLTVVSAGTPAHGTATTDGARITYKPALDFNGTDTFDYTVSDGVLTSQGHVTVSVTPVDDPPRIIAPTLWMSAYGTTICKRISAYDPENEALAFTAQGLPPGLSINAQTGEITGLISSTLTADYPVALTVSDPELSTTVHFTWRVLNQVWEVKLPLTFRN